MAAPRPAQIIAVALEVHCPYCDEPQPSPDDGADRWDSAEILYSEGKHECVSCDKVFLLSSTTKAQVRPCSADSMNRL